MNDDEGSLPVARKPIRRRVKTVLEAPRLLSKQTWHMFDAAAAGPKPTHAGRFIRYTRFSTEGQKKKHSTQIQLRDLDAFAEEQGIVYAQTYSDEAQRGATANREQLSKALNDCERHPGTTVAVSYMSRWAREYDIWKELDTELAIRGCRLLITEIGDVGRDAQAEAALKSQINYHELIEDMRNGRAVAIQEGRWICHIPYGYYKGVDDRLHPEPKLMKIIQKIFKWRAQKKEFKDIASMLNRAKIASPAVEMNRKNKGIPLWSEGKVRTLIKKDCYKGIGRQSVSIHPWEKGGSPLGNIKVEYALDAPTMRMVSDEEWAAAQANGKPNPDAGKPFAYLLSSLIMCPYCRLPLFCSFEPQRDRYGAYCRHLAVDVECPKVGYDYAVLEALGWNLMREASGRAHTAFTDELRAEFLRHHQRRENQRIVALVKIEALETYLNEVAEPKPRTPFEQRSLDLYNKKEAELTELKSTLPAEVEDFAAYFERHATPIGQALDLMDASVPFKPRTKEGMELLKVAVKAIKRVTIVPHPNGRGDVTFTLAGKAWGFDGVDVERTFRDVPIYIANKTLPFTHEAFDQDLKKGELRPDKTLLNSLRQFSDFWRLFPAERERIVHSLRLASKYQWRKGKSFLAFGFKTTLVNRLNRYLTSEEGYVFRKFLNDQLGLAPVNEGNFGKSGKIRTMRERLIISKHPILRLKVLDPSETTEPVTDSMWNAFVEAGLAHPDGSLRGGKSSDRRYLGTLLKVIRRNGRQEPLLEGEGSTSRLREIIRLLDSRGLVGPLTVAMLAEAGVQDLPAAEDVPLIADRTLNYVNRRPPPPSGAGSSRRKRGNGPSYVPVVAEELRRHKPTSGRPGRSRRVVGNQVAAGELVPTKKKRA